ncbi:3-demethylubiquinone-9 3-methyltransferase [Hyaloraphidium curvatum]|nr:3-demethylubiquinone-9 3-methyltransferase [Hyaloraphidium curvatum]
MTKPAKNAVCLWFDRGAEEAARFYAATFPDSSFTVMGVRCLGINGGPQFPQTEAFSFQVATADQAETDRYWDAIVGNGGSESVCGWCKDKWGVSWQFVPVALTEALNGSDRAAAKRASEAMLKMQKIDVAAIEAACRG